MLTCNAGRYGYRPRTESDFASFCEHRNGFESGTTDSLAGKN